MGIAAPEPSLPPETRFLKWTLLGRNGIRSGWSAAIFIALMMLFTVILGRSAHYILHDRLHLKFGEFTAPSSILNGALQFSGILGAAAIMAIIERRRVLAYNLTGPGSLRRFMTGILGGFIALSMLIAALYAGSWLHFGHAALSGAMIFELGSMWGIGFLFTGLCEEGVFRCYLQFTFTRGMNYWWSLGTITVFTAGALLNPQSNGAWGVFFMAALGLIPCLLLHLRKSPSASFWQAAWLTSTLFGYVHTFNKGESWFGIFCAAAIGFVFCASIRLTGSAWWAIGYHAAWDWGQTYFYGTPDSGFAATGHFLTTNPTGNVLWSGGQDGPEGSLLVLPIILLTLIYLVAVYGRKPPHALESSSATVQAQLS